ISADELGIAKAHPKVYSSASAYLDKLTTLRDSQNLQFTEDPRWFVAAHAWDLMGVKAAEPKFKLGFVGELMTHYDFWLVPDLTLHCSGQRCVESTINKEDEEKVFNQAFGIRPDASGADLLDCVEKMIAIEKGNT
ncbi:hypothetical protein HDU93_001152, partial [Gonapodya sp. JEL0774]